MQCNSPHYLEYQRLDKEWNEIEEKIALAVSEATGSIKEQVEALHYGLERIWERQVEISNEFMEQ